MATVRLQLRRGTDAQWVAANPILAAGELGVETDTRKVKIGDGTTAWNSLDYIAADNPEISEIAQDAIDAALVAGTGITKSYDDNANTITVSVDTSVIATKAELAEVAQDSIDQALTAGTGIAKNYDDAANTLTVSVDTDVIATKASPTFTGTVTLPSVNAGGNIIPSVDNTYDLGSPDKMWRDVYVGPGSIYVNGQKVLETDNGDVVVSADVDENLSLRTTGSGNLELNAQGSGNIQIKSAMSIAAGENITSSDGNPIHFASPISTDSLTSHSANTDLTITGSGTGKVYLNDNAEVSGNLTVGGNLTVSGSVTSINTETLNVADNIIDLNSNFTSGNPTENAGIKVKRGDEADVQFRWNETSNAWEFTDDGASYGEVSSTSYVDQTVNTHNLDTTDVHGIADTSILVTTTGTQTLVSKSLTSPTLTGTPTAPTAIVGNSSTQIATTEFVSTAVNNLVDGAPGLLNTLNELAAAINDDESFAANVTTSINNLETNKVNNISFNTHTDSSTNVHGILDTANLVYTNDGRLSDQRIPIDESVTTLKIVDQNVTTAKIADESITTIKIVDGNVTTPKIADNNVTEAKIIDNAITTAKIADGNVTTAKLADGAVTIAKLEDSAVTSAKIADGSILTDKIFNSAVTTDKINNASITTDKMQDLSITTGKIADGAVTTAKLDNSSVTTAKIDSSAIVTEKIGDSAVTTAKLEDGSVTDVKLAADSVTSAKIADGVVGTAKLEDGSVTNIKIASDAITSIKIADQNVTTDKITDSAVTTDKIANASVTEAKIAAGAITSGKIADGTIVNSDISVTASISQSKIENLTSDLAAKALDTDLDAHTGATTSIHGISDTANLVYTNDLRLSDTRTPTDNTVSTAKIQDSAVTTAKINDGAVTSGKIADGTIVNSDINASAAIDWTKLAVSSTVSSTELGYLDGVTSAIQTQLNAKALDSDLDAHTGASTSVHGISNTAQLAYLNAADQTFTGNMEVDGNMTVDGNLTVNGTTFNASSTSIVIEDNMVQLAHQNAANTVDLGLVVAYNDGSAKHAGIVRDVSDAKWKLFKGVATEPSTTVAFGEGSLDDLAVAAFEATSATIGDVSNTELQYLNGVTSAIQTQIDTKAPTASPTFTGTVVLPSTTSVGNVSSTELGYLDGVTSAIQTQIDAKAPTANPTFTGTVTVAASGVAYTDGTQTKAGVPSLTTIASATTGAYNLSTGGLALRDQLIPIGGAHQITVPTNATTAYPIGTSISFYQSAGTGGNFVGADGTVSILSTPGSTLRTTYSSATITKVATNTWLLVGDLKA